MITKEQMAEIAERMGEAVHHRWMVKRRAEKGWHAPEDCRTPPICPSCNGEGKVTTPLTTGGYEAHECLNCSGTGKVKCIACHPCMRPYKELPDSEKELDRQYPTLFFEILKEMGYYVKRYKVKSRNSPKER